MNILLMTQNKLLITFIKKTLNYLNIVLIAINH